MRITHLFVLLASMPAAGLLAQVDPGPPPPPPNGPVNIGPLRGLSTSELAAFANGLATFTEVEGVANGLGPRFNLDGCAGCHAQPSVGGSSPPLNPQIPVASKAGAVNQIPPFIHANGPVTVVRFRQNPDGTPDNGVHSLFVITGRNDAPSTCNIQQPDFSNTANLAFRIPTPLFGLGLIEAITDSTLKANLAAHADRKGPLGIEGRFNLSANDGTITRYGWKAQNKSLLAFSGEAYNVEIGVTNELYPQERDENPACVPTASPEDHSNIQTGGYSDIQNFTFFMRYLAPPMPAPPGNASADRGRATFDSIGCTLCHTPVLQTGNSSTAALTNVPVNLYSDLAVHRMGQALADGIVQGIAQGDEFRSAPLWGLGQRIFLLHDGRTPDLTQAIVFHGSPGSEAQAVAANFQALPSDQKQDLLNFLRSL